MVNGVLGSVDNRTVQELQTQDPVTHSPGLVEGFVWVLERNANGNHLMERESG